MFRGTLSTFALSDGVGGCPHDVMEGFVMDVVLTATQCSVLCSDHDAVGGSLSEARRSPGGSRCNLKQLRASVKESPFARSLWPMVIRDGA